jgi:hypothetical protein
MRGSKAKQLSKYIYQGKSTKEHKYVRNETTGNIVEVGLRKSYRILKELYKSSPVTKKFYDRGLVK